MPTIHRMVEVVRHWLRDSRDSVEVQQQPAVATPETHRGTLDPAPDFPGVDGAGEMYSGNDGARWHFPMNRVLLDCFLLRPRLLAMAVILDAIPMCFCSSLCAYAFAPWHDANAQLWMAERFVRAALLINIMVTVLFVVFWKFEFLPEFGHRLSLRRKFNLQVITSLVCFVLQRFLVCLAYFYAQQWAFGRSHIHTCFIIFVVNQAQQSLLLFAAHNREIQWQSVVALLFGIFCSVFIKEEYVGAPMSFAVDNLAIVAALVLFGYAYALAHDAIIGKPFGSFPAMWQVLSIKQNRFVCALYLASEWLRLVHVVLLFGELLLLQRGRFPTEGTVFTSLVRSALFNIPCVQFWIALCTFYLIIFACWHLARPASEFTVDATVSVEAALKKRTLTGLGAPVELPTPSLFVRNSRFVVKPFKDRTQNPAQDDVNTTGRTCNPAQDDGNAPPADAPAVDRSDTVSLGSAISEDERDNPMCVVCMDSPRAIVLEPCMHFVVCEYCTEHLVTVKPACPLCRESFTRATCVQLPGAVPAVENLIGDRVQDRRVLVGHISRSVVIQIQQQP